MSGIYKDIIYKFTLITLLILLTYGNTLNHGFVWDDIHIIVKNPLISSLGNIPKFFVSEDIALEHTGYYRPVTYVSFAVDHAIWGLNPLGFNLTNLILHILAALLFYRVTMELFGKENVALFAALIFALHPVAGETVNFHAGGRNTLLCACFSLSSFLCYMQRKYLFAIVFFVLGILSKEFTLMLPALFFLYDRLIRKEIIRWQTLLPYAVAVACYLAVRSFVVEKHANLFKSVALFDNIPIISRTVAGYFLNMVYPFNLKTMYDIHSEISLLSFLSCLALVVALLVVAWVFRDRFEIIFAVSIFLLFLLPVSNILPLGTTLMADRYAYLSLLGFSLGLGYAFSLLPRKAAVSTVAILLLSFMVVDIYRNNFWKDEYSLFMRMVKDAPKMSIGYVNLRAAAGRNISLALNPEIFRTIRNRAVAACWEGEELLSQNKPEDAERLFKHALDVDPSFIPGLINMGNLQAEKGDLTMALKFFNNALSLDPYNPTVRYNHSLIDKMMGKIGEAGAENK